MEKKTLLSFIILIIGYLFLFSTCKFEDELTKPVLGTSEISVITEKTAICTSFIETDGGTDIYARGVCWSTSSTPTADFSTKTSDGTGTGFFSSSIFSLIPNTTYYVRAYATNKVGTTYGNELVLTTMPVNTSLEYDTTITDIDGNLYHIIKIGNQLWMIENLKTTKYRDGTSIPNITDSTQWCNLTTGAYCDYDNIVSNSTTYGRLYNWYAINNTRKLAPKGWHVATNSDWITLGFYVGKWGSINTISGAGGKLKETGTLHWLSPNTGATNEYGFSALPGGDRGNAGSFKGICNIGNWWTGNDGSNGYAYSWSMLYMNSDLTNYLDSYYYGFSVRCVRD